MCEFAEMTTYVDPTSNETWLQGKLNIVVDPERVDESDLYGRLVCGHAELQTYLWSFKASYPNFAVTDDADGDPSIGVFNPADGSAELRWWEANGRLTYENFIDYDASTNELVYTFGAEDTSALTNSVDFVLGSGYDSFLRVTAGIIVEIGAL